MRDYSNINWQGDIPFLVKAVPAQLDDGDRRVYFNAAKTCITHDGVLIDTGTLAGGTSVALAAGALNSPIGYRENPYLYSFDLFKCDWATPEFFAKNFGGEWAEGSSFRKVYDDITLPFVIFMNVTEGDLLEYKKWNGKPIDVLGIDVWKIEPLAVHMLRVFFPYLRPGSVILQQDYRTVWLPWVHTMTEALGGYLEREFECHDGDGATAAFRVTREITSDVVEQVIQEHSSLDRRRELAISAANSSHRSSTALFVRLAHTLTERRLGSKEAAKAWLDAIEFPDDLKYPDFFTQMRTQISNSIAR